LGKNKKQKQQKTSEISEVFCCKFVIHSLLAFDSRHDNLSARPLETTATSGWQYLWVSPRRQRQYRCAGRKP